MRDLNIAVWGLGPHARRNILPAVTTVPGLHLYGLCSRNDDIVAQDCRQYDCVGWTDPDLLLNDPEVDIVYLATPIGLHPGQGQAVLAVGKHLWCEKPLGDGRSEVEPLVALSRSMGVTLGEGFMYLHHPQFQMLERVIESGRLGRAEAVTCRFGIPALDRPGFRLDPRLGGGAFLDVGVYPISALQALFPADDPEVCFAEIVTAQGSPVDTHGRAVLRYQSGASGLLEWRTGAAYRNEIDIWGTEGSVSSERIFSKPADHVPQFRFLDARGTAQYDYGEPANHFVCMFSAFRRLIEDEDLAERERVLIARRARLVGAIRDHCDERNDRGGQLDGSHAGR